jgi:uncharacterized protein (TIGR03437 family)
LRQGRDILVQTFQIDLVLLWSGGRIAVRRSARALEDYMKYMKSLPVACCVALLGLGCSDTLLAQPVITVTPTSLAFNGVPANSSSQPQNLSVTSSSNGTTVSVLSNQSWIVVNGVLNNVGTTPTTLPVSVKTQGLLQGMYLGQIAFAVSGTSTIQQTVAVSLTVTGSSLLSANPSSLSFTALQGANTATPSSATVVITSGGTVLNYTLMGQTQSGGGNWLLFANGSGITGDPAGFQVYTNPAGLAPGTYTGTITAQSTSTADSVQISVTLTVNANATLSVTPANPAPFLWQIGTADPAAQQLNVTSSTGTANYSVTVSPQVTWLVVSPLNGSTPGTISLFPKPVEAGLIAANYTTSVIVTSGSNQVTIPVTLIAAAHPLLQLSGNSLTYGAQFGSTTPPPDQTVTVSASDGSKQGFNFASDSSWLTASATGINFATSGSGITTATLTVRVNPTGQPLGSTTGNIRITPTNGDNYTQTITVTLSLTAAATLQAGPASLLFSYQTGQTPPGAQTASVTSTGQPLTFSVSPSITTAPNCPTSWLSATASSPTTPATVTITVPGASAMTPGLCNGAVSLNYTSATGPTSVTINVTTAVSAANQPELVVSMPAGFGVETAQLGAQTYPRTIVLTSTNGASVDYSAVSVASTVPFLGFLGPTAGITPTNLAVAISPSVATMPGIYTGSITISSTTIPNSPLTVPVTLTITSNVSVTVSPMLLTFSQAQGGPLPPSQTLTLASTGGTASFTSSIQYNTGANWLKISPSSGTASGPMQVSVQTNSLSQGTYTANIVLTLVGASTSSLTIPVTLNVGPAQTLTASPSSLGFSYQLTGATPASQTITVTSTGGPVTFNVGTTATPSGWLNTDIATGTTGGSGLTKNIVVTVNPQGLAVGTYNGSISITAPGVLTSPITIAVQLVVTPAPVPQPTTVRNSASFVAGVIAPGELISVFGTQLGPTTGVSFKLNSSGGVDPILSGVRVLFGGVPGTPTYVSATQINVIVPWELAGQLMTNTVVEYNGIQSSTIPLALATPINGTQQAPGLFAANSQGFGQLSAINQNGTYNGPSGSGSAPAPQGTVISVYGTGGPQTNPPSKTGTVTPIPNTPADLLNITGATATIGGVPATVQFAGAAPSLVTGVFQINILVPTGITPGSAVPITISFNGVSTPAGTTIAVQ